MSKTVLVTGINGFVGQHLTRELREAGCTVRGIGQEENPNPAVVDLLGGYYKCNLTDQAQVDTLPLDEVDAIINLAGLANVAASFDNPDLYKRVNVGTLTTLCSRLVSIGKTDVRMLAISTGAVYDSHAQPPFNEQSLLVPPAERNPYVVSKLLMEDEAHAYRAKGLDCVVVRPFNHIGPGQLPGFLLPDLADRIRRAVEKSEHEIMVGTLTNKRDFTDVRDVVRAYRMLALADRSALKHDTYNICSGTAVSGEEIMNILVDKLGVEHITAKVDESKLRPNDPAVLYGSRDAITTDCGWEPAIPLEQTIADFAATVDIAQNKTDTSHQ